MARDLEMSAMQTLSKLDDETRDRVFAWAKQKWPGRQAFVAIDGVVTTAGDAVRGPKGTNAAPEGRG